MWEALGPAVAQHLTSASGQPVEVEALEPLFGGACQDNFRIDVKIGSTSRRLVLRSDAAGALPGSLNRGQEFAVIQAAVAAGVPTPAAHWPTQDLVRPGAHAYFLDWRDGVAIGAKVLKDPNLETARLQLPGALAAALARIHHVPIEGLNLPTPPSTPPGGDPVETALQFQAATLGGLPGRRPGLVYALGWLERNRPAKSERTLVHGDFRVGNFLVDKAGLTAVLDWEFAHLGSPLEDVAWLCVRDWRFGQLKRGAGGLVPRRTFYSMYEKAAQRELVSADVHFWEVVGNLRWAAGALAQGERFRRGEQDLELLAVARRATEMEYEALRLIEAGPA
jgi:aminoglycoside phosphotransferase (APT) family kinase protein